MSNSISNPYGNTVFPIGNTSEQTVSLYSSTIFPTSTLTSPAEIPYTTTTFPTYTGPEYPKIRRHYLIDNDVSLRPTVKKYPYPSGLPIGLGGVTHGDPLDPAVYGTTINLKKDEQRPNPAGFTYGTRADTVKNIGNVPPGSIFLKAARQAAVGFAAGLGTAMTHQITGPAISAMFNIGKSDDSRFENLGQPYSIMPFTRKKDIENWVLTKYKDFRSFKGFAFSVDNVRLDGTAATVRNAFNGDVKNSILSAGYAAASILPGGAYTLFNLESIYGFGNHGEPAALRRDFTQRSQVATRWNRRPFKTSDGRTINGRWAPTIDPTELVTEFRGDKVNVIDFEQRSLKEIYRWKPKLYNSDNFLSKVEDFVDRTDLTKDFIKFYFTGPTLINGADGEDDVIVFRATIDSFSDTHAPQWNAVQMIGRADPNYTYQGYSRDVSISFTAYATSRDEMKPMYRKLNALASYTTPDYGADTIAMKSPWLRMTIGDLLVQQPVIINSLAYTFSDSDSTWEINVENDVTMMQAPHKVTVSLGFHVIPDYLPQLKGRMYTLAKSFNANAEPIQGGDNWLSDFEGNRLNEKLKLYDANRDSVVNKNPPAAAANETENFTIDRIQQLQGLNFRGAFGS